MANLPPPEPHHERVQAGRLAATSVGSVYPFEQYNLAGLDILESFPAIYEDSRVWELTRDVLQVTYSRFFGEVGRVFSHGVLEDVRRLPHDLDVPGLRDLTLGRRQQFRHSEMFGEYYGRFREENLLQTVEILGPENFSGVVVDIGCDDNRLGQLLRRRCGSVHKVIGTDIRGPELSGVDPAVEFRLSPSASSLPLHDEEADTIIIRYALHHMDWANQECILREARRALRAGGKLLILENSYSTKQTRKDEYGFQERTVELYETQALRVFLTALDTFSLNIKSKNGPFPSTYRTVEEWTTVVSSHGFTTSAQYFGYPMQDLHQAPQAVLVCEG